MTERNLRIEVIDERVVATYDGIGIETSFAEATTLPQLPVDPIPSEVMRVNTVINPINIMIYAVVADAGTRLRFFRA